jgi:acyl-CoA synthetase (AMP-forming)/AMP-acid ligase II
VRTSARQSLVEVLSERALAQAHARAFTFLEGGEVEGARLTWSGLDERTRAIGAAIASRVPAGARVLLLFPPGLDIVPAFFGALSAATIAIPAYPPAGARMDRTVLRLRGMIADAGVTLIVSTRAVRAKAETFTNVIPELLRVSWLNVDDLEADQAWLPSRTNRQPIAFLQYTSGSTANPRGVMVTHENLLHNLRFSAELGRFDGSSVGVSWLPVNHDMGLIQGLLQPVFSGYPCWLMSPAAFLQRPSRWLAAISRHRGTHSGGPNFAFDLCSRRVADDDRAGLDLASWQVAFNGSEPIRQDTLDAFTRAFAPCGFRARAFRPAYGLAEATLLVSSTDADEPVDALHVGRDALSAGRVIPVSSADQPDRAGSVTLVSCGRARGGMKVAIVDPVARTRCAPGTVGEIWVRGGSVTAGYWRRGAETAAAFEAMLADDSRHTYLRTGDLGFLASGRLYVTGRIKDVLIVRGVKHYPQDLERSIEEIDPAIRPGCAAVFAMRSDGDEIAAAIELDLPKHSAADDAMLNQLLDRVRTSVVQMHGVQLSAVALLAPGSIPKTTSGKLQRFACREGLASGMLQTLAVWMDGQVFVGTPLERTA